MNIKEEKSGNGEYRMVGLNDKVNKEIWEKNPFIKKKKKKIAQMSKGRTSCRRPGAWGMGHGHGD